MCGAASGVLPSRENLQINRGSDRSSASVASPPMDHSSASRFCHLQATDWSLQTGCGFTGSSPGRDEAGREVGERGGAVRCAPTAGYIKLYYYKKCIGIYISPAYRLSVPPGPGRAGGVGPRVVYTGRAPQTEAGLGASYNASCACRIIRANRSGLPSRPSSR